MSTSAAIWLIASLLTVGCQNSRASTAQLPDKPHECLAYPGTNCLTEQGP